MAGMSMPSGSLTVDDLARMPDDGRRYELVDGELLVSPAPGTAHQWISGELFYLLRSSCPPQLRVFAAPYGVRSGHRTELQPDLLVARIAELTDTHLPTAPLLAVEIASPSTRHTDRGIKRRAFERIGVPSYWLVEPDPVALTVLELVDGRYQEVATVTGDDPFEAARPFPVRIVPRMLLGRLAR